jgi:hypothetical protein
MNAESAFAQAAICQHITALDLVSSNIAIAPRGTIIRKPSRRIVRNGREYTRGTEIETDAVRQIQLVSESGGRESFMPLVGATRRHH